MPAVLDIRSVKAISLPGPPPPSSPMPADRIIVRVLVEPDQGQIRSFQIGVAEGELMPFVESDHAFVQFGEEAKVSIQEDGAATSHSHGEVTVTAEELGLGERAADFRAWDESHFRLAYFVISPDQEPPRPPRPGL